MQKIRRELAELMANYTDDKTIPPKVRERIAELVIELHNNGARIPINARFDGKDLKFDTIPPWRYAGNDDGELEETLRACIGIADREYEETGSKGAREISRMLRDILEAT